MLGGREFFWREIPGGGQKKPVNAEEHSRRSGGFCREFRVLEGAPSVASRLLSAALQISSTTGRKKAPGKRFRGLRCY